MVFLSTEKFSPFFLIFRNCRIIGNVFSWFYFIPRKIVTEFIPLLTLELKSRKISDNFPMDEFKSGKHITNFPAISKNEEKKGDFFRSTKNPKILFWVRNSRRYLISTEFPDEVFEDYQNGDLWCLRPMSWMSWQEIN